MEKFDIFKDIAERTGGDIYIGVVGAMRSGKSTFIRRFMEGLVLPYIKNPNERDRARDELPQSWAGRTIMTTEPKFVPEEAVEVDVRDGLSVKVRLVDCVGYIVPGALGYEDEDGQPRMVSTPWLEEAIPFATAAEIGTRKVISEHATLGVVVTTDGSVVDLPRENYVDAEERVIWELKEIGKPFLVVLNSIHPDDDDTVALAHDLEAKYEVPVLTLNCDEIGESEAMSVLEDVLYEFPVAEVNVSLPRWVEELEVTHWLRQSYEEAVRQSVSKVKRLREIDQAIEELSGSEHVQNVALVEMNLGTGQANIEVTASEALFHQVLEEETGYSIKGDHQLLRLMRELALSKKEYDKIAFGLQEVQNTGYGMVTPTAEEMQLQEPEMVRQGGRFGVRLKATAPSYHFIRADISTEITPLIGTEKQCEELVKYILDEFQESPQKIWETNIFGKSLHDLVREGIQGKLYRMPENAQLKLQETVERIVNDGGGGLICIII